MFTSDVVPQAGVLVTVSWRASRSWAACATRPTLQARVTGPARGSLAACPSFTRQTCGWRKSEWVVTRYTEYATSIINKQRILLRTMTTDNKKMCPLKGDPSRHYHSFSLKYPACCCDDFTETKHMRTSQNKIRSFVELFCFYQRKNCPIAAQISSE